MNEHHRIPVIDANRSDQDSHIISYRDELVIDEEYIRKTDHDERQDCSCTGSAPKAIDTIQEDETHIFITDESNS